MDIELSELGTLLTVAEDFVAEVKAAVAKAGPGGGKITRQEARGILRCAGRLAGACWAVLV